jgi:hypothetical protein
MSQFCSRNCHLNSALHSCTRCCITLRPDARDSTAGAHRQHERETVPLGHTDSTRERQYRWGTQTARERETVPLGHTDSTRERQYRWGTQTARERERQYRWGTDSTSETVPLGHTDSTRERQYRWGTQTARETHCRWGTDSTRETVPLGHTDSTRDTLPLGHTDSTRDTLPLGHTDSTCTINAARRGQSRRNTATMSGLDGTVSGSRDHADPSGSMQSFRCCSLCV